MGDIAGQLSDKTTKELLSVLLDGTIIPQELNSLLLRLDEKGMSDILNLAKESGMSDEATFWIKISWHAQNNTPEYEKIVDELAVSLYDRFSSENE